jgi:site-specific recombinase XerC
LSRYLAYVQTQRRLAPRSLVIYAEALLRLQNLAAQAGFALLTLRPH